ncbi:MAG: class I SAM-dependent methyltransferase [Candidatus Aminicenantes bacterium]|jgi:SAM-dependent methyltransferase
MSDIYYDDFLSKIYDDSPYFGQARSRELDKFNGFYYGHLKNNGQRILEFGSATGVLSIPLARLGHKLDSVDISPYMHEVLSGKLKKESKSVADNINQIEADATIYKGPQLYNSIVMPEGILVAIPDEKLQMKLLENCHRNLKPGGRIYTDFSQPWYKAIYNKTLSEYTRFRTRTGDLYILNINCTNNEYTQIQDWKAIYTKIENGDKTDVIEINVKFRYIFYSEIQLRLKQCGFKVIDIDVSYADSRGFAVIAEKH